MSSIGRCRGAARLLALVSVLLLALPPAGGAPRQDGKDRLAEAKTAAAALDWQACADLLIEDLKRRPGDLERHELLGRAMQALGRCDEAAHYLDLALREHERAAQPDAAKALKPLLYKCDELADRRDKFLDKSAKLLIEAAEQLFQQGHEDRALEVLVRATPLARGELSVRAVALRDKLAAARSELKLDEVQQPDDGEDGGDEPAELEEFFHETEHYTIYAHLEPKIVQRIGVLMEDLHRFYVQIYFDGDATKITIPKATIRIHPTQERMGAAGGPPGASGYWSPGERTVVAYDTRSDGGGTGSLDWMMEVLFHEASHQFTTMLEMANEGRQVPTWMNEGTASFFEGAVAMADGRVLWPRAAQKRLDVLVWQLQSGASDPKTPSVKEVVSYPGPGSYPAEYYTFGWGLAYFLQQYEDPKTFEFVYRPGYARYRGEVLAAGGEPYKLFEALFSGPQSPLQHANFEEFAAFWRQWILSDVAPLHRNDAEARTRRMARFQRYMEAAKLAATDKKAKVGEQELLSRALGELEWVKTRIDKPDAPDGTVLLAQAEICERLKRNAAAAALYEQVLSLVEEGALRLDADDKAADKKRADIEKRLAKLDQKNAPLRAVRARTRELQKAALPLLSDYKAKDGLELRAYTFANLMATALSDTGPIRDAAASLREQVRTDGKLLGVVRTFSAKAESWKTRLVRPAQFEAAAGRVSAACRGGTQAYRDTSFAAQGEHEFRAVIRGSGPVHPGSAVGVVLASHDEFGDTLLGIDENGKPAVWTVKLTKNGGTTLRRDRALVSDLVYDRSAPIAVRMRVGADGTAQVWLDEKKVFDVPLPYPASEPRQLGVFVKDSAVAVSDAAVEMQP